MAKESSILNPNRNPGMTKSEAESIFRQYFGVTNFIWLEGKIGADITDYNIDGTARFANGETIVTYFRDDFVNMRHDFLDVIEDDVLAGATEWMETLIRWFIYLSRQIHYLESTCVGITQTTM